MPLGALRGRAVGSTVRGMDPLDVAIFHRNSMLTVDATINDLAGDPADITALTGDDIRWAISRSQGGPRLATLSLTPNSYGQITKLSAPNGTIRIQFRAPLPPDEDPDPFRAGRYWQECEVTLSEVATTQFFGPVLIQKSMFTEDA